MPLREAATARTNSTVPRSADYDSLTMDIIEAEIIRKEGLNEFYAFFHLERDVRSVALTIKQSDDSLLPVEDLLEDLVAKGYVTSANANGATVELRVLWD